MDSDQDVLRSRGWNGLFDQDSLVGGWAGMYGDGFSSGYGGRVSTTRTPSQPNLSNKPQFRKPDKYVLPSIVSVGAFYRKDPSFDGMVINTVRPNPILVPGTFVETKRSDEPSHVPYRYP